MATTQQPAFTAYAITKRGKGQDDWWNAIGAAFAHQNGDGYNIVLQALPLDGKIVLRPPRNKDANEGEAPGNNGSTRQDARVRK